MFLFNLKSPRLLATILLISCIATAGGMNKGDLINKVQEGASLSRDSDPIIWEDSITSRQAPDNDPIVIVDVIMELQIVEDNVIIITQDGATIIISDVIIARQAMKDAIVLFTQSGPAIIIEDVIVH